MSGKRAAAPPHGYRSALDRLESAQKPGSSDPAYLRWVNRPLGRRAAAVAYVMGLRPNAVTLLSGLLSLAALILIVLAPATPAIAAAAAVLLLLGYILDSADGQLARLTHSSSPAGEWLDHVVDAARLPLFHLAIAMHFFRTGQPLWLIGVAAGYLVLTSLWFFAQTLAEKLTTSRPEPTVKPSWVSWAKIPYDVGTLYLVVFALAFPPLFATIYLVLFAITLAVAALSLVRKYRSLASGAATTRTAPTSRSTNRVSAPTSAIAAPTPAPTPLVN